MIDSLMGRDPLEPPIDASAPAVVLRSGRSAFPQHGALGVVRSLGRLDVHVTLASPIDGGIAGRSRYVADRMTWAPRGVDDDDALAALRLLGERRPGAVLIPTDDLSAVFVDAVAADLADRFRLARAPVGIVPGLVDKRALADACERAEVPTPRTAEVRTVEDADAFLDGATPPIVVKSDLAAIVAGAGRSVMIAATRREALGRVADAAGRPVLLQEHIPGLPHRANWMFDAYLDGSSSCRFAATGRKTGQYPAYSGMATAAVSERNDEVSSTALALLGHLGYAGPVDVDLRFDTRDGRYKVIDVNPRVGGTFRLFVAPNGVDVIRAMYLDLTGQGVPTSSVPDGRTWVVETHVLASAVAYRRDGWTSAGWWLRSLAGTDEGALFGWDDLRPMVGAAGHAAARAAGRLAPGRSRNG